jgi:hypothetical protein
MPRKDPELRSKYELQYKERNSEKVRAYQAEYRKKNKELISQKRKQRAEANKVYAKEYRILYKENVKLSKDKYIEKTRPYVNSYVAERRAKKIQRTPKWLSAIDIERIKNEYRLADIQSKLTGEPWHVDHIIPLQGKNVSGLHVPSNLKAIRGSENMRKHNSFGVSYA